VSAGGSGRGGWDHLKVLIIKKKWHADARTVKYVHVNGGKMRVPLPT
jgi:tripartite-type tricarboxylate transporter receptor subunit TctC